MSHAPQIADRSICASPATASYFDNPERKSIRECLRAGRVIRAARPVKQLLEGCPDPVCVLNAERQVVFANHQAERLFRVLSPASEPIGHRLGEIIGCVSATAGPAGCGTGRACRHCGAGKANFAFSRRPGRLHQQEFRARCRTIAGEQALTYRIHVAPLVVTGHEYRVCTLTDLTAMKTREILDRLFFHDVLNTCQAVRGAAELLPVAEDAAEQRALASMVRESAIRLVEEVEAHRDLTQAEDGSLVISKEPRPAGDVVREVVAFYHGGGRGEDRRINVDLCGHDVVWTSPVHLRRCVMNLVKNALEAGGPDDPVTIVTRRAPHAIRIAVHNSAVMSERVQAQVFQRSFSTKAARGRGLGTYGVRLLMERYLGGRVDFVSAPGAGTTFTLTLPCANGGNYQESEQ